MNSKGESGIFSSSKIINDLESAEWRSGVPGVTLQRTRDEKDNKI